MMSGSINSTGVAQTEPSTVRPPERSRSRFAVGTHSGDSSWSSTGCDHLGIVEGLGICVGDDSFQRKGTIRS